MGKNVNRSLYASLFKVQAFQLYPKCFPQGFKALVVPSKMFTGNVCQYGFKYSIRHFEIVTHAKC